MDRNRFLLQFWDGVFAIPRLRLHHRHIRIFPTDQSPGMHSPCLQAGAAMEDDHHVFAKSSRLFFLTFAQAFASRHHQHDRHNSPGNAKHGEECTEFVCPQGSHDIDNEVSQGHRASVIGRARAEKVSLPRARIAPASGYVSVDGLVARNSVLTQVFCGVYFRRMSFSIVKRGVPNNSCGPAPFRRKPDLS